MRGARVISWGLPLVTAAVYVALLVGPGAELMALAGGQPPPDLRWQGYGLIEMRDWLRALPPAGIALAQGPVLWLDTLFPPLMGLTLAWWMRPYAGVFGMVCVLAAMSYVALDWGENVFVQRLLTAGQDYLTPGDVARASAFTQGKFAAFGLCAVLAIRQSWRRTRREA
jgi:hypothetical protein